jgi:hypothetical protein
MANSNALFELSTDAKTYRAGDLVTGRAVALDNARRPTAIESRRARLGWAVQTRFVHARQMRQRDLLFLDVVNEPRSPAVRSRWASPASSTG